MRSYDDPINDGCARPSFKGKEHGPTPQDFIGKGTLHYCPIGECKFKEIKQADYIPDRIPQEFLDFVKVDRKGTQELKDVALCDEARAIEQGDFESLKKSKLPSGEIIFSSNPRGANNLYDRFVDHRNSRDVCCSLYRTIFPAFKFCPDCGKQLYKEILENE